MVGVVNVVGDAAQRIGRAEFIGCGLGNDVVGRNERELRMDATFELVRVVGIQRELGGLLEADRPGEP